MGVIRVWHCLCDCAPLWVCLFVPSVLVSACAPSVKLETAEDMKFPPHDASLVWVDGPKTTRDATAKHGSYYFNGNHTGEGDVGYLKVVKQIGEMRDGSVLLCYPSALYLSWDPTSLSGKPPPTGMYDARLFEIIGKKHLKIVNLPRPYTRDFAAALCDRIRREAEAQPEAPAQ